MNRTVREFGFKRCRFSAVEITRRMSATVLSTPLSRSNFERVTCAMTSARLVLPVPGGPWNKAE